MKQIILLVLASVFSCEAYTEFYINNADGNNLNAGSTTNGTALHTYAAGTFVRSTGVFTVSSGNPSSDGVAVGDWVSVYTTGEIAASCVARVTERDATTITISLTAIGGATANVSEGAGASTCKHGGCWQGPGQYANAAQATNCFPFTMMTQVMTNAGINNLTRYNFKGGSTYSVSNAMTTTQLA